MFMNAVESAETLNTGAWANWKEGVLCQIRAEYRDLFPEIAYDDINWDVLRPLYEEGCTPYLTVSQGLACAPRQTGYFSV